MSKVVVNEPELSIFDDLREKLLEIRSKRDALAYNHEDLKRSNDNFNKIIIMLSLFTAFCETVKTQLGLTDPDGGYPKSVQNLSAILPIFLSTVVGIISSLLKFKKFPEKMEEITKATEKCNFSILRIRQLQENINFQSPEVSLNTYNSEVMGFYREALDAVEKTMYPKSRGEYFETAQKNIIKIHDSEKEYTQKILEIKKEKALLDTDHMQEDLEKNKRMVDLEAGHGLEKTACDEETLKAAALGKSSPARNVKLGAGKVKLADLAKEVVQEVKAAPLVAAIAERDVILQDIASPRTSKTIQQQREDKQNFIKASLQSNKEKASIELVQRDVETVSPSVEAVTFSEYIQEQDSGSLAVSSSNSSDTETSHSTSEDTPIVEESPPAVVENPIVEETPAETIADAKEESTQETTETMKAEDKKD